MKKRQSRRGFTLVELLVVIGIIGILVGIMLPMLSAVRISAREVRSENGLRQMMFGYTRYHQANEGAVLFGYCPATINGMKVQVSDSLSGRTFGSPLADRYPWRLVPYVGDLWQILHSHDTLPPLPTAADSESVAFGKAYTLSLSPTYGINGCFVGGDRNYDGFVGDKPQTGKHIVFKSTEVLRPSSLIVFADSKSVNAGMGNQGMHFLTPPRTKIENWKVVNEKVVPSNTYQLMGIPQGWYSPRIMVAFFDNHVQSMLPGELQDMRLWANYADAPDYVYR